MLATSCDDSCPPGTERAGDRCVAIRSDAAPLDAEPTDAGDGGTDAGPCGSCEDGQVCDTEADPPACVDCVDDMDCDGDTPVCDTATNTCVGCLENADCTDPTASLCDTTEQTCIPCTGPDDCSHLDGLGVCDDSGEPAECVECLPGSPDACGTRPCSAARSCSEYDADAQELCEPCDTDENCAGENEYCVPMMFDEMDRGTFCLTDRDDAGGCTRPLSITLEDRTTVSGREGGRYCGINEDVATCEAVLALLDDWRCTGTDGLCSPTVDDPEVDVPGALCRNVGGLADRCTYECTGATQCDEDPNHSALRRTRKVSPVT